MIVLIVILFIVVFFIFTRLKSLEQRQGEVLRLSPQQEKRGGSLLGFSGKAIWDALENPRQASGWLMN